MTWFRNGQWVDNDGNPIDLSDAPTAGQPEQTSKPDETPDPEPDETSEQRADVPAQADPREGPAPQ